MKSINLALLAILISAFSHLMFVGSAAADGAHHSHAKKKVDYNDVEEHVFGRASDPDKAVVTIEVEMADTFRFEPSAVEVRRGDTVRFIVKNKGQMMHEMVLGTEQSLAEHAELMKKFPGMEHDEPHMAHIGPGKKSSMGWQFTQAGEFRFGCLIPGHFDAGMVGTIIVR